jgi:hypothetical protein
MILLNRYDVYINIVNLILKTEGLKFSPNHQADELGE